MGSASVHDPEILDVLSAIEATRFDGSVYRAVFRGRDPTVGGLAGGRWSPPQTFETLYTSFKADCAIAEVQYHLERQPIFPSVPVEVHELAVATSKTIDISTKAACDALGLDDRALSSLDYSRCQAIGHAIEFLGFDSFVVKSARCESENLIIIVGNLVADIVSLSFEVVDWSKYR